MNTDLPISQRRRQSNPSPSPILPNDLIVEILSLLNVKSLMKMKCVSKTWNTFISDPKFVKNHLNQSSQNSHLCAVSYNNYKQKDDYSFISFSINDLLENRSISLPSDPYHRLINKYCHEVVGSCNGLVCLLGYGHKETWLRLWNPATRTISDKFGYLPDLMFQFWYFAFGYDNSTDSYKVMALHRSGGGDMTTEMRVLSFGNNVWRNIQSFPARLRIGGVHLNCTFNWLAITKNGNLAIQFVIISLDLGTKTHTQLPPPPPLRSPKVTAHLSAGVCVLLDTLCFYHDFERTDFVSWKMTKFGDGKSWTQFLKFSYHKLQMDILFDLWGIHLFESGDTLVLTIDKQDQAILYNWRNHTVVKTTVNKDICWYSINNYVESLVSTC